MRYLIYLLLALVTGGVAKVFIKGTLTGGVWGLIIAAFIGSWLVDIFLSSIRVYDVNIISAILGAVVFIYIYSIIFIKKQS
ncbi:MAG TPA: hypothetical protein PK811_08830 [bacterium]|nr:hypothetical protein [bacterium]